MKYREIPREEAEELIKNKKLTPAYLYEAEHAPKGTEFVYVDMKAFGKKLFRVREVEK